MRAPVRSARKRSVKQVQSHDDRPAEASSLAERVKKRRRVSQAPRYRAGAVGGASESWVPMLIGSFHWIIELLMDWSSDGLCST